MQQPGFSADLDSFDLLDVIQMITMSRRSLALQVNTGLEERGILRFVTGELVWAEYGNLRGEEAFFALAAHKNGTAVQQPWNESTGKNVTQPLSRLIFQALQYRSKYAPNQALTIPEAAPQTDPFAMLSEYDDRPFVVEEEPLASSASLPAVPPSTPPASPISTNTPPASFLQSLTQLSPLPSPSSQMPAVRPSRFLSSSLPALPVSPPASEVQPVSEQVDEEIYELPTRTANASQAAAEMTPWWEKTGEIPLLSPGGMNSFSEVDFSDQLASLQNLVPGDPGSAEVSIQEIPNVVSNRPLLSIDNDLETEIEVPFWMSDQPTSGLPAIRPGALAEALRLPQIPQTPALRPENGEEFQEGEIIPRKPLSTYQPNASAEHLAAARGSLPYRPLSGLDRKVPSAATREEATTTPLQPEIPSSEANWLYQTGSSLPVVSGPLNENEGVTTSLQRIGKKGGYNISALVSALQTLGYALRGFVAAAVMNFDGQPIAQVAIDDVDVVVLCKPFSHLFQEMASNVDEDSWGKAEDLIFTTSRYNMFFRRVSEEKRVFQILVTTRDSTPSESLAILLNVAGAIEAAL